MTDYTEITLDLTGCSYLGEIHQRIKDTFSFPEYYGENWDAFLDAFRTVGIPDKIIIKGEKAIPDNLASQLNRMHKALDFIQEELAGFGEDFIYQVID